MTIVNNTGLHIWVPKNWCFWTVVLEKTLESSLDCKEIQPVHPKGNQSWIFIGRTDAEAETPILWPPDGKNWLIWKAPDAGQDWRQQEKGMTEDEMVGWHHWVNGHEFEQAMGVGEGQEHWHAAVRGVAKNQTRLTDWASQLAQLNWANFYNFKTKKIPAGMLLLGCYRVRVLLGEYWGGHSYLIWGQEAG